MPREVHDEESGAILFKKTDEEKQIDRIEHEVNLMSHKVDYIFRAMKRYEPVFEQMLKDIENK